MFEELGRDVFVDVIFHRQLDRDSHQVQAKHSHPAGGVALLEASPVGKRRTPVEYADVVESKEAALENIVPFGILAVHPPGECNQHFVENGFEKCAIAFSGLFAFDLINAPRCPGQHRRIHVVKIPFVGGNFSARMQVPFADNEIELRFGELNIDERERQAMKGEVPRCVPGKLPFVRH